MTISYTRPEQYIARAIRLLLILIVIAVTALVFFYNQNTAVRRAVAVATKEVEALRVENTKLKNQVYALTDNRSLIVAVERAGYIKTSNPTYVTFLADGSVRDTERVSLLKP